MLSIGVIVCVCACVAAQVCRCVGIPPSIPHSNQRDGGLIVPSCSADTYPSPKRPLLAHPFNRWGVVLAKHSLAGIRRGHWRQPCIAGYVCLFVGLWPSCIQAFCLRQVCGVLRSSRYAGRFAGWLLVTGLSACLRGDGFLLGRFSSRAKATLRVPQAWRFQPLCCCAVFRGFWGFWGLFLLSNSGLCKHSPSHFRPNQWASSAAWYTLLCSTRAALHWRLYAVLPLCCCVAWCPVGQHC